MGKASRKAPVRWWTTGSVASLNDPITLEPLRILRYPPFLCRADPTLAHDTDSDWFDGHSLAAWMVGSRKFTHPASRREITRDEAVALDAYLVEHKLQLRLKSTPAASDSPGVAESYDRRHDAVGTGTSRAAELRAESQELLTHLLSLGSRRGKKHRPRAGAAGTSRDGHLGVIGDNLQHYDGDGFYSNVRWEEANAAPPNLEDDGSFPTLPGARPKVLEPPAPPQPGSAAAQKEYMTSLSPEDRAAVEAASLDDFPMMPQSPPPRLRRNVAAPAAQVPGASSSSAAASAMFAASPDNGDDDGDGDDGDAGDLPALPNSPSKPPTLNLLPGLDPPRLSKDDEPVQRDRSPLPRLRRALTISGSSTGEDSAGASTASPLAEATYLDAHAHAWQLSPTPDLKSRPLPASWVHTEAVAEESMLNQAQAQAEAAAAQALEEAALLDVAEMRPAPMAPMPTAELLMPPVPMALLPAADLMSMPPMPMAPMAETPMPPMPMPPMSAGSSFGFDPAGEALSFENGGSVSAKKRTNPGVFLPPGLSYAGNEPAFPGHAAGSGDRPCGAYMTVDWQSPPTLDQIDGALWGAPAPPPPPPPFGSGLPMAAALPGQAVGPSDAYAASGPTMDELRARALSLGTPCRVAESEAEAAARREMQQMAATSAARREMQQMAVALWEEAAAAQREVAAAAEGQAAEAAEAAAAAVQQQLAREAAVRREVEAAELARVREAAQREREAARAQVTRLVEQRDEAARRAAAAEAAAREAATGEVVAKEVAAMEAAAREAKAREAKAAEVARVRAEAKAAVAREAAAKVVAAAVSEAASSAPPPPPAAEEAGGTSTLRDVQLRTLQHQLITVRTQRNEALVQRKQALAEVASTAAAAEARSASDQATLASLRAELASHDTAELRIEGLQGEVERWKGETARHAEEVLAAREEVSAARAAEASAREETEALRTQLEDSRRSSKSRTELEARCDAAERALASSLEKLKVERTARREAMEAAEAANIARRDAEAEVWAARRPEAHAAWQLRVVAWREKKKAAEEAAAAEAAAAEAAKRRAAFTAGVSDAGEGRRKYRFADATVTAVRMTWRVQG